MSVLGRRHNYCKGLDSTLQGLALIMQVSLSFSFKATLISSQITRASIGQSVLSV